MDVWLVDLDGDGPAGATGSTAAGGIPAGGPAPPGRARLTEEEQRRGRAFLDATAARRFRRSRLAVRDLLGRWLGVPPAELRLAYTPLGKPYLPDHPGLHVSWSRSGPLLLVGVAGSGPLGVDIERLRPVPAALSVLATVYPALPAAAAPTAFFPAWTLLEASVKATGRGLDRGAREVRLGFAPGGGVALRGISGHGPRPWHGRTAPLPSRDGTPAAVAAVVTQGGPVPPDVLGRWPTAYPWRRTTPARTDATESERT
ncbi:4'-phosphopantetheinyl transferase family protein [Streptomyces sp. NPDC053560]|uniref:4'-phosphopantetheinyl transferase family protein n=1 Tax=Streptomyces sp. NPDC053560 TaxID=3365711 RepID=UPI0037D4D7E8